MGAFTANVNNKFSGKFSTTPLMGNKVVLLYMEPNITSDTGNEKPRSSIVINHVVHGFRQSPFSIQHSTEDDDSLNHLKYLSDSCEINVKCSLCSVQVFTNNNQSVVLI